MKLHKKFLCLALLVCTMCNIYAGAINMDYVDHMSLTPPELSEAITPYGTSAPSKSNEQNISNKSYYYSIDYIQSTLYTAKWLTGVTKMKVTIENWKIIESGSNVNFNGNLEVTLYNSKKRAIDSKSIELPALSKDKNGRVQIYGKTNTTFEDLSASEKYYIGFTVGGGKTVSFDGTISKG